MAKHAGTPAAAGSPAVAVAGVNPDLPSARLLGACETDHCSVPVRAPAWQHALDDDGASIAIETETDPPVANAQAPLRRDFALQTAHVTLLRLREPVDCAVYSRCDLTVQASHVVLSLC